MVKAKEQVVAGTLHHLTLEILEAGEKKLYEAKVWVKPWLNFKELQEFKPASDAPAITPSDLGWKKGMNMSRVTNKDIIMSGDRYVARQRLWLHLIMKFMDQMNMDLDGGKFLEMILKCSTLLSMLSRPSSRGLTPCSPTNFRRLCMLTLRYGFPSLYSASTLISQVLLIDFNWEFVSVLLEFIVEIVNRQNKCK